MISVYNRNLKQFKQTDDHINIWVRKQLPVVSNVVAKEESARY